MRPRAAGGRRSVRGGCPQARSGGKGFEPQLGAIPGTADGHMLPANHRMPGSRGLLHRVGAEPRLAFAADPWPARWVAGDLADVAKLPGGVTVDIVEEAMRLAGEREAFLFHLPALAALGYPATRPACRDARPDGA